jgi:nitrite reductase/ring-hydroxylating ferredoxin subunit
MVKPSNTSWNTWNLYVMCLKHRAKYCVKEGNIWFYYQHSPRLQASAYEVQGFGQYFVDRR